MDSARSFEIDPDIRRARTLPAWVYSDRAIYQRVRERVFVPSWQFVGTSERVKVAGQAAPFTLLEGGGGGGGGGWRWWGGGAGGGGGGGGAPGGGGGAPPLVQRLHPPGHAGV